MTAHHNCTRWWAPPPPTNSCYTLCTPVLLPEWVTFHQLHPQFLLKGFTSYANVQSIACSICQLMLAIYSYSQLTIGIRSQCNIYIHIYSEVYTYIQCSIYIHTVQYIHTYGAVYTYIPCSIIHTVQYIHTYGAVYTHIHLTHTHTRGSSAHCHPYIYVCIRSPIRLGADLIKCVS